MTHHNECTPSVNNFFIVAELPNTVTLLHSFSSNGHSKSTRTIAFLPAKLNCSISFLFYVLRLLLLYKDTLFQPGQNHSLRIKSFS